jgi:hypothetical protein
MATKKQTKVTELKLEALMLEYKTKSGVVRYLTAEGWTRSDIARFVGIRYQHVRNIQLTPLKKG